MRETRSVDFELRCIDLPGSSFDRWADVRLGIQKGKAVEQDVPADQEVAVFRFQMEVAENVKTGQPNFRGPYAQGTPSARFVYLNWGERDKGEWKGFRRAKLALGPVDWDEIERAIDAGRPLRAMISMTNDRDEPMAASIPPARIRWLE